FVVFVQVAETRSFVAAGRALGLSASAIGKRIARLEARLNVRLFHRSTRSITLTAEGARFLERCRRVIAEIDAAERELTQSVEAPRGRLRVSLPTIGTLLLPVLADFMAAYPEIELDIDFSDRIVDVIDEGFDVVLRTACLPEFFVRDTLADGRLCAVLDDHVASRTPFYVLWPSGRHPLPKLRAFVDYMAEHLRL
ncbi:LysR family transcriptional regulator, partial [Burkholderia cenocepacia]|nr:LysR family transcriptional regulator [Burkholderia cenocepacia]